VVQDAFVVPRLRQRSRSRTVYVPWPTGGGTQSRGRLVARGRSRRPAPRAKAATNALFSVADDRIGRRGRFRRLLAGLDEEDREVIVAGSGGWPDVRRGRQSPRWLHYHAHRQVTRPALPDCTKEDRHAEHPRQDRPAFEAAARLLAARRDPRSTATACSLRQEGPPARVEARGRFWQSRR